MILVERSSMNVYSYEGRLVSSPRWASLNTASLNPSHISLGPDSIAVRDQADEKCNFVSEISIADRHASSFSVSL